MKFMLLAAAAVLAAPAIAQTTPATPDQTMPAPADPATMPEDQTTPTDGAMPTDQTPTDQTMPAQAPMAPGAQMGAESPGGYQPSMPALQGGTPGATPMFKMAPSPSEAFPPPAPKDSYPPCKKGQYDGCTNPGGK